MLSARGRRAATSRTPVRHAPRPRALGVCACAPPDASLPVVARRPRPMRLPPGQQHAPRRLGFAAPRTSSSPRRTRAMHAVDCRSIRGPAVRVPAEERRSTAASWLSSPRHHHRSSPALFKAPAFSSRPHRRSTAPQWPPSR
jgi:hypothetical protein